MMRNLTCDERMLVAGASRIRDEDTHRGEHIRADEDSGGGGGFSIPARISCCSFNLGPVTFEADVFELRGDLADLGKTDPFDTKLGIQTAPQ